MKSGFEVQVAIFSILIYSKNQFEVRFLKISHDVEGYVRNMCVKFHFLNMIISDPFQWISLFME